MPSDREAPLEAYAEYFHGVSEEVEIAMQLLDALSAYTSPEHMLELRGTFAGALAAVDRDAVERCAKFIEPQPGPEPRDFTRYRESCDLRRHWASELRRTIR